MEHTLRVGETAVLKRSFFGRSSSLVYAGMPSRDVFSLVVTWGSGYHAAAYNLYIPIAQRELELEGVRLSVERASPEELRYRLDAGASHGTR